MFDRVSIKLQAKERFRENTGNAICIMLVLMAIEIVVGLLTAIPLMGVVLQVVIVPLSVGAVYAYSEIWQGRKAQVVDFLNESFDNFGRKLGGMLWMTLWVILWTLLFYIPGIVKAFSYAMTPYILARYPNVPAKQALRISMRAMHGHKLDLFVFSLSFLGWALRSALTGGILYVLYVGPYLQIAQAGAFEDILDDAIARGAVSEEELGIAGDANA